MISIVMPVYNPGKYFTRCLDSIIAQTYQDWELIAVDDCSTDGSYELLKKYSAKDTRIKVYNNAENLGCGLTRRKAIGLSIGEWFSFVDSDDYIDNCFLSEMLRACRIWDAEIAICGSNNHHADYSYYGQDIAEKSYNFTGKESYTEYMTTTWVLQYNCNKLFSRRVIESVEYSERRFCEDSSTTYLWLWNADKITVIPRSYYHYVHHDGSNSHKTQENNLVKTLDTVKCLYEHWLFCKDNGFDKILMEKIEPCLRAELTKGIMLADTTGAEYAELDKIRNAVLTDKQQNNEKK